MSHFVAAAACLVLVGFSVAATAVSVVSTVNSTTHAAGPSTPNEAIAALLLGNARYAQGKMESHNLPAARSGLAAGQAPFAGILRCADSRVAPEIVFDQPLGDLFVCGVAGNIPTSEIIASMEYAVAVLGTRAIVVMGHSSCGAVDAALTHRNDSTALPGSLPELIDQIIVPCAIDIDPTAPGALDTAIACNARHGISGLLRRSRVLFDAVKKGDLKIVAGVQDLKSGRFTLLDAGN